MINPFVIGIKTYVNQSLQILIVQIFDLILHIHILFVKILLKNVPLIPPMMGVSINHVLIYLQVYKMISHVPIGVLNVRPIEI